MVCDGLLIVKTYLGYTTWSFDLLSREIVEVQQVRTVFMKVRTLGRPLIKAWTRVLKGTVAATMKTRHRL